MLCECGVCGGMCGLECVCVVCVLVCVCVVCGVWREVR